MKTSVLEMFPLIKNVCIWQMNNTGFKYSFKYPLIKFDKKSIWWSCLFHNS